MFAIKFEYDNGVHRSDKICFVLADSKERASDIFNLKIKSIFYSNEDICTILAITKIPEDANIIYGQGSVMWAVGENKLIW